MKGLKFISSDANFMVEVSVTEKVNENIYFGSIKTNCGQKFYTSSDLLILCSMLRKNITLFGTIKNIAKYNSSEIIYFSDESNELLLSSGEKVILDNNIDVEYEFFNEKKFKNEIKIFENQLDIYIHQNIELIQREA